MSSSSDKERKRVAVTYFPKPPDRLRTVLEQPAIRASDTLREMPAVKARGADAASRTTLEIPVVQLPPAKKAKPSRTRTPPPSRRSDGIDRHGAKTLGEKQIAEMALYGHSLFEQGKLRQAKTIFEGLVELGVEEAFPHTMLGILMLMDGEREGALALFEAALALEPRDLAARVYRAEIRLQRGDGRKVLAELEALVEETSAADPFGERARRLLSEARRSAPARRNR